MARLSTKPRRAPLAGLPFDQQPGVIREIAMTLSSTDDGACVNPHSHVGKAWEIVLALESQGWGIVWEGAPERRDPPPAKGLIR